MSRKLWWSAGFLLVVGFVLFFMTPPGSHPIDPRARHLVAESLEHVSVVPQRIRILGYQRAKFGVGWGREVTDQGHYCSTRELMLQRSFPSSQATTGSACPQADGEAVDEYTAKKVRPHDVDIDHIFPLSASWDLGAHSWSAEKRYQFANDWRLNLAITAAEVNREKSDSTLADWLPPIKRARCPYVARFLTIAVAYDLSITTEDAHAARKSCRL